MARRDNIAGLAALAALGYGILKSKKGEADSDMKRELARSTRGQVAMEDEDPDYARELARAERGQVAIGAAKRAAAPSAPKAEAKPSAGQSGGRGLAEATAQLQDYRQRQLRDREAGMTRGTRPADPRDLEAGMSRGRREEGPPKVTVGRTPSRVGTVTDIPGSSPEGWTGGTGERVTGNEVTRNLEAMMLGRGPTGLAQKGAILAEGAAIARANRAARAAQAAKEAEREAIANPLNWMSGPRGELGKRALSEADTTGGAIGFKRGGKISAKAKPETKSAAKGWGKARGARQAKIY